jgi:hypothetical protein
MPKLHYGGPKIGPEGRAMVRVANRILEEYAAQGFDLTLRQLYYQMVARDLFPADRRWRWTGTRYVRDPNGTPNAEPNYKWLGSLVNDARMSGLIDWEHIVDRTRNLSRAPSWNDPAALIRAGAQQFAIDKWADQDYYVEAWIEKDALVGVIEPTCREWSVPYFSCRGYTSQSEMWGAAQRLGAQIERGKRVVILHMGDHDPSGIDMTRDIDERLENFMAIDYYRDSVNDEERDRLDALNADHGRGSWAFDHVRENFEVQRIALNWEQVQEYGPPPNPAKLSDARAKRYVAEFGRESWELDALDPTTMADLITEGIENVLDPTAWEAACEQEADHQRTLRAIAERWDEVADLVRSGDDA